MNSTPGDKRAGHDPYAALRLRDYRFFVSGNLISMLGSQMASVAIGWELYQRTNSPTALGLVGLVQIIPVFALSIPAGSLVDRYPRRHVIFVGQLILILSALTLGLATFFHAQIPPLAPLRFFNHAAAALAMHLGERNPRFVDPYIPLMYAVICTNGIVRSFNQPAKHAFLPQLVPPAVFPNAVTWNMSLYEICSMIGPTLGGAIIALMQHSPKTTAASYAIVYWLNATAQFAQLSCLLPLPAIPPSQRKEKTSLRTLSAGVRYVFQTKIILATLSLDMFAVILGGATALLPIFARDILHMGPGGLGWLRAAESVGAMTMAMSIAHLPPMKHAGRNLLWAVAGFGVATIGFGLSHNFWLSFLMLAFIGAFDNVSVVIRHTLLQILTPDEMRGRVSSVNTIFVGSSDQIGSLESGATAALFGPVASVVMGGVGAVMIVATAAYLFPDLRRFGPLQPAQRDPEEQQEELDEQEAKSDSPAA